MRLLTRYYLLTLPPLLMLAVILAVQAWKGYQRDVTLTTANLAEANRQTTALLADNPLLLNFLEYRGKYPLDPVLEKPRDKVRHYLANILQNAQQRDLSLTGITLQDIDGISVLSYGTFAPPEETFPAYLPLLNPQTLQTTLAPLGRDRNTNGLIEPEELLGYLQADFRLPLQEIQAFHLNDLKNHQMIIGLSVLAMVGLIFIGGRSTVEPVEEMVLQAEACADGETSPDFAVESGPREIQQLSRALERMMATIGQNRSELLASRNTLKSQLEFQQTLIDTVTVPIFYKDCDGKYIGCNRAFMEITGKTRGELLGRKVHDIFEPSLANRYQQADEALLSQGGRQNYDAQVRDAEGHLRDVIFQKTAFRDAAGKAQGIIGAFLDISHQKASERELQAQKDLLQTILDTIPSHVYWKDRNSIYLGGNRLFAEFAGLNAPDELVGKTIDILPLSEEGRKDGLTTDHQLVETGISSLNREYSAITPQGLRTFITNKVALTDAEGEIIGLVGVNTDITDRVEAERARAHQEMLLSDILETIPANVFWKDKKLRYQGGNGHFTRAIGLDSIKQAIGKGKEILPYPPDVIKALQAMDRHVIQTGEPIYDREMDLSYAGHTSTVLMSKVPLIDHHGKVQGVLGISTDISHRKRTAEALQKKTETLQQLLNHLPVAVYWKDQDSQYLATNRHFNSLHNLNPPGEGEVLPLDAMPYAPEILQQVREEDAELFRSGEPLTIETTLPIQNDVRIFLSQKVPVKDDDGTIIGLLGIDMDITDQKAAEQALRQAHDELEQRVEDRTTDLQQALDRLQEEVEIRKQTEEALQASESRFRELYNHTPVLMLALAPNGAVISVNDYLLETLGYTRPELLGEDYRCLMAPDKDGAVTDLWQSLFGTSHVQDLPIRVRTKAMQELDVLVTASVDQTVPESQQRLIVAMVDITERLRAEQELLETLEQLEELDYIVNHSPAIAFLWEAAPDWPVVYVSDNIRQFGYTPKQIQDGTTPFSALVHTDDLDRIQQEVAQYTEQGHNEYRVNYRLIQQNGSHRWVECRTWIRRDIEGQPTHYQGLILDVHEQRLAEQQLRETLARLEDLEYIVNNSPAVAFLCRAEQGWPVEFVSSNIQQFGYEADDFLEGGLPYTVLIHPEDLPWVEEEMDHWSNQPDATELHQCYRMIRPDGEMRWIDDWNWVRRNEAGEITHYQGLILDVTDQKQAENELRQLSEDLSGLIQHANAPIFTLDPEGLITDWNDSAQILSGYTRQEALGRDLLGKYLAPHSQTGMKLALQQVLKGEAISNLEATLLAKEGNAIELLVSMTARQDQHGKVAGAVVVGQDITTRKQAEKALQDARDRAEEANKAKSHFLATMSHEIRTPMNAIIGMTHMALQTQLDPLQHEYLDAINDSTKQLLHLVNDILDFSKIEAGKLELAHAPFDLGQILRNLARTQGLRAWQKGLYLDLCIADQLPTALMGDPGRIQQVLVNLTENALKFTDELGITVQVEEAFNELVEERELPQGTFVDAKWIHFRVSDTGIGVPVEHQQQIFERFRQSDNSTTRQYGGTGLGLAICRELISRMGGDIWVESTPGQGSCFQFIVPLQPAEQMTAVAAEKPRTDLMHSGTLLLAEDNPINLKVARHFLEQLGYQLLLAQDGQQVLDCLRDTSVDLVLMDIEMPVLDGLEATRMIRAGECGDAYQELPIIALTAHAFEGYREHCLAAGMDDFMTKPLDFPLLHEKLQHWLQQRAGLSRATPKSLDRQKALRKMEGDSGLLLEVNAVFLEELPNTRQRLEDAMNEGDLDQVQLLAHGLKAPAAMVGADRAFTLAQALERQAETGDRQECVDLLEQLLSELAQVGSLLEDEVTAG